MGARRFSDMPAFVEAQKHAGNREFELNNARLIASACHIGLKSNM